MVEWFVKLLNRHINDESKENKFYSLTIYKRKIA
jgi:hypothetical protein